MIYRNRITFGNELHDSWIHRRGLLRDQWASPQRHVDRLTCRCGIGSCTRAQQKHIPVAAWKEFPALIWPFSQIWNILQQCAPPIGLCGQVWQLFLDSGVWREPWWATNLTLHGKFVAAFETTAAAPSNLGSYFLTKVNQPFGSTWLHCHSTTYVHDLVMLSTTTITNPNRNTSTTWVFPFNTKSKVESQK